MTFFVLIAYLRGSRGGTWGQDPPPEKSQK